jgi:hypothetical protein
MMHMRGLLGMIACFQTTQKDIVAYRLTAHHLACRSHTGKLVEVCGAVGFKNPSPWAALSSFSARLDSVSIKRVEQAFLKEKTLAQTMSLRQAIRIFPRSDAPVFTRGLLPSGEEELLFFVKGVQQLLVALDYGIFPLLDHVRDELPAVLRGRELTKDQLGLELARQIEGGLDPSRRQTWRWPSGFAVNQTLGEAVVRFLLPLLCLEGLLCMMPQAGNAKARSYRLTADFFGKKYPAPSRASDQAASEELVARYLHCYGPATEEGFARWAGVGLPQARRMWEPLLERLVEVAWDNASGWMLEQDAMTLGHHPIPDGLRLLGPNDPWIQQDDRSFIVQGKQLYKYFYKANGVIPGMVLYDGQCVAGWFQRRQGNKLYVTIEDMGLPLTRVSVDELDEEVARLALAHGLRSGGFSLTQI